MQDYYVLVILNDDDTLNCVVGPYKTPFDAERDAPNQLADEGGTRFEIADLYKPTFNGESA